MFFIYNIYAKIGLYIRPNLIIKNAGRYQIF